MTHEPEMQANILMNTAHQGVAYQTPIIWAKSICIKKL